jgi:TonB family protein
LESRSVVPHQETSHHVGTRGRVRTTAWRLTVSWRFRALVIFILVIVHAALFYAMAQMRARQSSNTGAPLGGPSMFGPVISEAPRRGAPLTSRALDLEPGVEDQSTPPPRHWRFPPIDIWPSAPGWSSILTDTPPVTDAQADPPDTQTPTRNGQPNQKPPPRPPKLRMVRWFRPEYRNEWALAGMDGSVVLDLLINPSGQPVQTTVAQHSGSPELDEAALRAANLWRFAPPTWKSRPIEVWGRVELRFNFFSYGFSLIGEPVAKASPETGDDRNRAQLIRGRERTLRRIVEQVRSVQPDRHSFIEDPRQRLGSAARDWGPVTRLDYLGVIGKPEWRIHAIKPEYRSDPRIDSVAIQWDLYRIEHEHSRSLWKVAFDHKNQVWAVKAEPISSYPGEKAP